MDVTRENLMGLFRETSFGLLRSYRPKERIVPFYKNRYYQLLWGQRKASVRLSRVHRVDSD